MLGGPSAARFRHHPSLKAGASGDVSMPPPLRLRRIRLRRTGGGGESSDMAEQGWSERARSWFDRLTMSGQAPLVLSLSKDEGEQYLA